MLLKHSYLSQALPLPSDVVSYAPVWEYGAVPEGLSLLQSFLSCWT